MKERQYQLNYVENDPSLFDAASRKQKARKILAILEDCLGPLRGLSLLDASSSTGIMTRCFGSAFDRVVGIDIDTKGLEYAGKYEKAENVQYCSNLTLWGLRKLVRRCEVIDYTIAVLRDSKRFFAEDMVAENSRTQTTAIAVARRAYWLMPGYIWLLRRPQDGLSESDGLPRC